MKSGRYPPGPNPLTITSAASCAIGSASKRSTSARNAAFAACFPSLAAARLSLLPNISAHPDSFFGHRAQLRSTLRAIEPNNGQQLGPAGLTRARSLTVVSHLPGDGLSSGYSFPGQRLTQPPNTATAVPLPR